MSTGKLLRIFIYKEKWIDNYSYEDIMFIADWFYAHSKKILDYKIQNELFDCELKKFYMF